MSTEIESRGTWITLRLQPSGLLELDGRGVLEFDLELMHDLLELPPPSWTGWVIQAWDDTIAIPEHLLRSSRRDELLDALEQVPRRDLIWFEPTGVKARSGAEGRRMPPVVMFALVSPNKFARLVELATVAVSTPGARFAMELERATTRTVPLAKPRDPAVSFFTYHQPPLILQAGLEASVRAEARFTEQLVPAWVILTVASLFALGMVFG